MTCIFKAIRGAITVFSEDTVQEIQDSTLEMAEQIISKNSLKNQNIVSVYFSLTVDLKSANPATIVRKHLGWNDIPMICGQEAFIEGGLEKCIRILMHVCLNKDEPVNHIYLKDARSLREDWVNI